MSALSTSSQAPSDGRISLGVNSSTDGSLTVQTQYLHAPEGLIPSAVEGNDEKKGKVLTYSTSVAYASASFFAAIR
jgi:hypothetical protein